MSKTSNSIQMLQLLRSRKKMSREELARELNTNIRNIGEYKKELSEAGYIIDSTQGVGGGYFLVSGPLLPILRFSEREQQALNDSKRLIETQGNFLQIDDYITAMDKIQASYDEVELIGQVYLGKRSIADETLAHWINETNYAIQHYQAMEISYQTLKETKPSTFIIHPYRVIVNKDAYYCLAYSLKRKEFRIYRFSRERMKSCNRLTSKFNPNPDFNISDYIGQMNLVKDQTYHLRCTVTGDSAIRIAESEVGIEVSKEWVKDTLLLSTIMEGEVNTVSFLLSLGNDVVVHEPKYIRELVIEKIEAMKHNYQ